MSKYYKNGNWFYGKESKYLHNEQKSNKLCRFYTTPRGCKNGENCKYIHEKFASNYAHKFKEFFSFQKNQNIFMCLKKQKHAKRKHTLKLFQSCTNYLQ